MITFKKDECSRRDFQACLLARHAFEPESSAFSEPFGKGSREAEMIGRTTLREPMPVIHDHFYHLSSRCNPYHSKLIPIF